MPFFPLQTVAAKWHKNQLNSVEKLLTAYLHTGLHFTQHGNKCSSDSDTPPQKCKAYEGMNSSQQVYRAQINSTVVKYSHKITQQGNKTEPTGLSIDFQPMNID